MMFNIQLKNKTKYNIFFLYKLYIIVQQKTVNKTTLKLTSIKADQTAKVCILSRFKSFSKKWVLIASRAAQQKGIRIHSGTSFSLWSFVLFALYSLVHFCLASKTMVGINSSSSFSQLCLFWLRSTLSLANLKNHIGLSLTPTQPLLLLYVSKLYDFRSAFIRGGAPFLYMLEYVYHLIWKALL